MHPIPKARFEQFSDGVFAIAITLLAIELHGPILTHNDFLQSLKDLTPLLPNLITFVISFVTIAIFWVNHHQLTHALSHVDRRRILWSNILFLMFVTLIPFATQGASSYPFHHLTMLGYSVVFFGASLSFTALRYFVHRSIGETKVVLARSLFGPSMYLVAAIVSVFSIEACYLLLVLPALYYFLPKSEL